MLDVYFVVSAVGIILNPEHNSIEQFVMFHQFNIAAGVNFFPPADYFIGAGIVNVFD